MYITPNAYSTFRLNSQSGNAAFSFALIETFTTAAGVGPTDAFIYPINTAMVAKAIFNSEATAAKALGVLTSKGVSFNFNGQLVRCNATLQQARGTGAARLRPSAGFGATGLTSVTLVKATLKANLTLLGVKDFPTYAGLQLVTEAATRSALGQADSTALIEVVLRPSFSDETLTEAAFSFSDADAGASLRSLLAQGGVEMSWNNKVYTLQPDV